MGLGLAQTWGSLTDETADVLADAGRHRDGEAGLRWNREFRACGVSLLIRLTVEHHGALAVGDFHDLCFVGAEVIGPWVNQAEGFLFSAGKEDAVGDDFAVKVDIGFGDGGDVRELHRDAWLKVLDRN